MPSVREYLYWTIIPGYGKYSRLVSEEEQIEAMTYMSINVAAWGAFVYYKGGESMLFTRLGFVLTSPHVVFLPPLALAAAGSAAQFRSMSVDKSGVRGTGSFGVAPSLHLKGGKPWWN